ncbi:phosphopantetheine-binding protein [Dyella amyloliquefaciens]|uniref:phosphopantetheine-binding protein n=1 Tax=Dyella amyloliquefaciens TaxID=1770545 RepID=UPI00102E3CBD|nr:phosphopantetheine-binding protein [Dyella amyloliquefaciens]
MNDLQRDIAQLIIDTLSLEDIEVSDITPNMPLFGEGLGLDSIDALELALALQKRFDIQIASDSRDARQHFANVASLASFVEAQRAACAS